jgi:hypothetical protein
VDYRNNASLAVRMFVNDMNIIANIWEKSVKSVSQNSARIQDFGKQRFYWIAINSDDGSDLRFLAFKAAQI